MCQTIISLEFCCEKVDVDFHFFFLWQFIIFFSGFVFVEFLELSVCLTLHIPVYVVYYYRPAHIYVLVIPLLISVSCLLSFWLFLLKWMCCYGSRELANQSAGCISLLEIAVKNQLPDCAAVNRDWQRRAEWRRCCHRSLPPEKEPVHRTCAVLSVSGSVCVAGAVSPGATPPTL